LALEETLRSFETSVNTHQLKWRGTDEVFSNRTVSKSDLAKFHKNFLQTNVLHVGEDDGRYTVNIFLNCRGRWEVMVSFTLWPFYLLGKCAQYWFNRKLARPQNLYGRGD
jgi:hypothetical protein